MSRRSGQDIPRKDDPIRVLVVDDHQLVAASIASLLDATDGIDVVGVANTADEAHDAARRTSPEVVVIDQQLGKVDGIACAAELKERHPGLRALILSFVAAGDAVAQAVREGCDGFLSKATDTEHLIDAIRAVHAGGTVFGVDDLTRAVQSIRNQDWIVQLSARELDVLHLMASGAATDAMANTLHISQNTVRSHVRHILEKLGAHSKLEAVSIALRQGIISPPTRLIDAAHR